MLLDFSLNPADIDHQLGLQVESIEASLLAKARQHLPDGNHQSWGEGIHRGNQSWVGLDPQTLQTPYSELERMCQRLSPKKGERLVDLGAGYGRLGIVMHQLCPEAHFLGYEFVPERVEEGKRIFQQLNLTRAALFEQDLTSENFQVPEAEFYFLYDYGKVSHIRQTLNQLSQIADRKTFHLVGRGKGSRSLIEHEFLWLTGIYQEENFTIYSM